MYPPRFSTSEEVENFEIKYPEKSVYPWFEWGDPSKENGLYVMHSPRVKLKKNIYYDYNFNYDDLYKRYFIELIAN